MEPFFYQEHVHELVLGDICPWPMEVRLVAVNRLI